jgi:hypothetical protein
MPVGATLLALVAGVVAGYLAFGRPAPSPRSLELDRDAAPSSARDPGGSTGVPVAAAPPVVGTPADARRASTEGSAPRGPSDPIEARARRLAAREPYARAELGRVLEGVLAGKLPDRELGAHDYEQLVEATLRLRAALRVLRGIEESPATSAVREAQRESVRAAFAEMEAITGLAPTELGSLMPPDPELTP